MTATLPERDFPPGCADLYPRDFVYPVGWLPSKDRVTDREVLLAHEPWQRPYLKWCDGKAILDDGAVVAVRRLSQGAPDNSIQSAIRYLEWGEVTKDPAMNASFQAEDMVEQAALWSEAGAHELALGIIRSLPEAYQRTARSLEALSRSLAALSRYAEALEECERLVEADGLTDYARELHRIEKAGLLLHLDRRQEAESLLDERREVFETFWAYHGMRAAIALIDGKAEIAKAHVRKAGRLDDYHSYKLLWNRHLTPLADFIRSELLTEDNEPRIYERNKSILRLCHSIHGALVRGDWQEAQNLAETLVPADVTDWSCTEALALAWVGNGDWESIIRAMPALPGGTSDSLRLVRELAGLLTGRRSDSAEILSWMEQSHRVPKAVVAEVASLVHWHCSGRKVPLPAEGEVLLADVAPKNWGSGDGRDRWLLVHQPGRGLIRQKYFQDRAVHRPMGWDLRKHFPVLEENCMSRAEAADWLERLLQDNVAERGSFIGYKWSLYWNGWQVPSHLMPDSGHPLLAEAIRLSGDDPNFYFHNGPACTFGLHSSFAEKLAWVFRHCFSGGQRRPRRPSLSGGSPGHFENPPT